MTAPAIGSPDASLVVSLFHSERYLKGFVRDVRRFANDIELTSTFMVELMLVLNSPSAAELHAAGGLDQMGSSRFRVRSVQVARETLYASWNRGIRLATGGVLGFWNVDDCRYLSAVVEAVAGVRSGASLMYFPYVIDRRWRKWGFVPRRRRTLYPAVEFDPEVFRRAFRLGPFFMFSRALYEDVGPFDEQFSISGDLDWSLRAQRQTAFVPGSRVAGVYVNEYRGLSVSGSERAIAEHNAIYARHGLTDLTQPADEALLAEYDVRRVRVGSTWQAVPGFPSSPEPAVR